jgi:leucyl aminopeptidase
MKYSTTTSTLADIRTDCLVGSLSQCEKVAGTQGAGRFFKAAATDFEDKAGQILLVSLGSSSPIRKMLVVGGLKGSVTAAEFTKAAKAAAGRLNAAKAKSAVWALAAARVKERDPYWKASTSLSAVSNAVYAFNGFKSGDAKPPTLKSVAVHADARSRANIARAVRHGQAAKLGLDWARDLGNTPPNICNPVYLLKEARKLARKPNVTVTALDEKKMTELGMGAFMSVTQGSEAPGKMIIIRYRGAKRASRASDAPVVLIGKGITFDTGGISLKPGASMHEMKWDMCGAATVMGTTRAVIEARLPVNLITIVAAAENMPSGRASRPGDIVETYSGKTVEILNTDAEGRLVLCDALTYAARFKPSTIIDVATLTGAAIMALGAHATAVYANDDDLAAGLLDAGETSGDRGWRMPLWDEYQASIKSQFADMANIGTGGAGSVTAACFLSRFAVDQSWAHLDVAGTAFPRGPQNGATGRPVGMLFRYLIDQAEA